MEKIDARKLGPEGRETLRKMVLRLNTQSGMNGVELAKIAGVHVRTVQAWLRKARRDGAGALVEKTRGRPYGACRKLTMAQEVWVRQRIVAAVPEQLSLPFALWTRRAIQALVEQQFGLQLSDRLVGKYLKRWGYTAQRPVKKAMEQRNDLVQAWLRERYPAIAARAKAEGAEIHWGDESGLRSDDVRGRGFAPKGQTPVVRVNNKRHGLSIISTVTNKGQMRWRIFDGALNTTILIDFLRRLIKGQTRKLFLILDNLRVHHARQVKTWLAEHADAIEVFYLPSYSPELNPDEMANADIKQAVTKQAPARTKLQLVKAAAKHLRSVQRQPERIRKYFEHGPVRYAA